MGKVYISNAFSTGMLLNILEQEQDTVVKFKKILSTEEVKEILETNNFISVVGHESTAKVLQILLGINIPVNRVGIQLEKGDKVVIFQLNQRLQEGVILDEEEIKKLNYTFILAEII